MVLRSNSLRSTIVVKDWGLPLPRTAITIYDEGWTEFNEEGVEMESSLGLCGSQ